MAIKKGPQIYGSPALTPLFFDCNQLWRVSKKRDNNLIIELIIFIMHFYNIFVKL